MIINIIEVDQWTATGNIEDLKFDEVGLDHISGGDSEAVKVIFGGSFKRKQVEETAMPNLGYFWFIKGENGKCKFYKGNPDTSD